MNQRVWNGFDGKNFVKQRKKSHKLTFTTNTAQNKIGRKPIFVEICTLFSQEFLIALSNECVFIDSCNRNELLVEQYLFEGSTGSAISVTCIMVIGGTRKVGFNRWGACGTKCIFVYNVCSCLILQFIRNYMSATIFNSPCSLFLVSRLSI